MSDFAPADHEDDLHEIIFDDHVTGDSIKAIRIPNGEKPYAVVVTSADEHGVDQKEIHCFAELDYEETAQGIGSYAIRLFKKIPDSTKEHRAAKILVASSVLTGVAVSLLVRRKLRNRD